MIRRVLIFGCVSLLASLSAAWAEDACDGLKDPVLSIEMLDAENQTTTFRSLTRSDLKALETTGFTTTTIWTEGPQDFVGLWVSTLLRDLGVEEGDVTLQAFNDYSITVPASTFVEGGALLAVMRNGEPMTPRSKGPLWVVWNYDAKAAYRTESIYALSIWQLDRIKISR